MLCDCDWKRFGCLGWPKRECRQYRAEYQRERRTWDKLEGAARARATARAYANVYLRGGILRRGPCVVCGGAETEMHHRDYLEPLGVIWLCRGHHLQVELYKLRGGDLRQCDPLVPGIAEGLWSCWPRVVRRRRGRPRKGEGARDGQFGA